MLDDLRSSADELDFDDFEEEEDALTVDFDESKAEVSRFLGLTPVERMFISIFLFMNVVVLGLAILLATGRMQF